MSYTARDIIYGSLRLIGQLAEGEVPSAETAADSLTAMNQMLDSWSTERLSVFCTQDQVFTWPVNQSTRTLGPSGNFLGNRPIQVQDSTYFVVDDLTYLIAQVNEDQYNAICLKSSTSTFPQVMWVNYDMPDVTMKVYPVPTSTLEMHIISVSELSQPANLSTVLVFPPGYMRAFRFNLAVEIAAEFGIEPAPRVLQTAKTSKRNLKRINNPNDLMSMPNALISRRRSNFNIWTGQPY